MECYTIVKMNTEAVLTPDSKLFVSINISGHAYWNIQLGSQLREFLLVPLSPCLLLS